MLWDTGYKSTGPAYTRRAAYACAGPFITPLMLILRN